MPARCWNQEAGAQPRPAAPWQRCSRQAQLCQPRIRGRPGQGCDWGDRWGRQQCADLGGSQCSWADPAAPPAADHPAERGNDGGGSAGTAPTESLLQTCAASHAACMSVQRRQLPRLLHAHARLLQCAHAVCMCTPQMCCGLHPAFRRPCSERRRACAWLQVGLEVGQGTTRLVHWCGAQLQASVTVSSWNMAGCGGPLTPLWHPSACCAAGTPSGCQGC